MAFLTKEESSKVSEAIKQAESKTSGEIAVVIAKQSSDYAVYELTIALVIGVVSLVAGLVYYNEIESCLSNMFWESSARLTASVIGLGAFVLITILYFLFNIPFLDRLIVPKKVMTEKVKQHSEYNFLINGVHKTRDRTGVLIYISRLEKQVRILADTGIAEIYPNSSWQKQVDRIVQGIKNDKLGEDLSQVILTIGEVLTTNFPIKDDDTNELSDSVKEI